VVLFRQAHRRGMFQERMPEEIYRWGVIQSASPVLFFLISVPIAFTSTGLAVACWFLGIPFAIITQRWAPARAGDYFS
jgi:hypothetical protein